jgi:hypothetical protein
MYTGSLPTISNRADWKFQIGLTDSDTGETIDFTGCTMQIDVRDDGNCLLLSGSTSDKITVPEVGVAQIWFTTPDVHGLCAGTYKVGITVTGNGETVQLFAGSVPVVDGVVP